MIKVSRQTDTLFEIVKIQNLWYITLCALR